jgi:hypothetical protein
MLVLFAVLDEFVILIRGGEKQGGGETKSKIDYFIIISDLTIRPKM